MWESFIFHFKYLYWIKGINFAFNHTTKHIFQYLTSYSFVAIFQQHQPLEVTFQNSNDILELVSGILIFSTDLSCLHRSYSEKTTLLLGWRHRYEMSVTLHHDLIVRSSISISHMAMYLIPFTQLVCFLFHLQNLYRPRLWVIWRVSYKKLKLSTWRAPRILHFWWVCVSHLLVFCDMSLNCPIVFLFIVYLPVLLDTDNLLYMWHSLSFADENW